MLCTFYQALNTGNPISPSGEALEAAAGVLKKQGLRSVSDTSFHCICAFAACIECFNGVQVTHTTCVAAAMAGRLSLKKHNSIAADALNCATALTTSHVKTSAGLDPEFLAVDAPEPETEDASLDQLANKNKSTKKPGGTEGLQTCNTNGTSGEAPAAGTAAEADGGHRGRGSRRGAAPKSYAVLSDSEPDSGDNASPRMPEGAAGPPAAKKSKRGEQQHLKTHPPFTSQSHQPPCLLNSGAAPPLPTFAPSLFPNHSVSPTTQASWPLDADCSPESDFELSLSSSSDSDSGVDSDDEASDFMASEEDSPPKKRKGAAAAAGQEASTRQRPASKKGKAAATAPSIKRRTATASTKGTVAAKPLTGISSKKLAPTVKALPAEAPALAPPPAVKATLTTANAPASAKRKQTEIGTGGAAGAGEGVTAVPSFTHAPAAAAAAAVACRPVSEASAMAGKALPRKPLAAVMQQASAAIAAAVAPMHKGFFNKNAPIKLPPGVSSLGRGGGSGGGGVGRL